MAETYSVSITASDLTNDFAPKVITIGDSGAATHAQRQQSMMRNTPILCKNPDGSQSWYTIDPTHFYDGVYRLLKVS